MIADPALVLVDFQNDFGKSWNDETEAFESDPAYQPAIDATVEFVERYRQSGRTPIFVRGEHHEYTVSETWAKRYERTGRMWAEAGTEGAEWVPELDVRDDDPVISKNRFDGFYQTNLDLHLSTNGVTRLLVGGISTNVCVASTIHGAYNRDYAVTLLSDCTAGTDPDQTMATFDLVDGRFGRVRKSTEIELDPV